MKIIYKGIIVFVILCAYFIGFGSGLISGAIVMNKALNNSVCDFINKSEENGACIMSEDYKYDILLECKGQKFKFKGERVMNTLERIAYLPQNILYYPIMQCKLLN